MGRTPKEHESDGELDYLCGPLTGVTLDPNPRPVRWAQIAVARVESAALVGEWVSGVTQRAVPP